MNIKYNQFVAAFPFFMIRVTGENGGWWHFGSYQDQSWQKRKCHHSAFSPVTLIVHGFYKILSSRSNIEWLIDSKRDHSNKNNHEAAVCRSTWK